MEWFVHSGDSTRAGDVRRQFLDYLARHGASPGADRRLAELAFDELVGNAHRHAPGPVWVHVDWRAQQPVLHVRDAGPGFNLAEALAGDRRGGLRMLSELMGPLHLDQHRARGADVSLALPVRRAERPVPVPVPPAGALPSAEEVGVDGLVGRESFLRALAVQLAQVVEQEDGPVAAEAAVTAVGGAVGARIEQEYRRARGLTDRLSPVQVAELLVRLKAAIGGDFYVISVSDERIVLGNRRCPFGAAVQRAPALCGMTSSVFGGIAARNAGRGSVALEQRISVGDAECRVVVGLGEASAGAGDAHRYVSTAGSERLRAVLAEDSLFLREPLVQVLADAGVDVVAQCDSPDRVAGQVRTYQPDVAIIDFRESESSRALAAAREVRDDVPTTGVLVLAEEVRAEGARELLQAGSSGVGYLLKDRLEDVDRFLQSVRSVATGGAAIDPEVVSQVARLGRDGHALGDLTRRELQVLGLVADGLSNEAVAERLVVTKRAVEKHISNIFLKLDLPPESEQERRVLAVRRYWELTGRLRS